MSVTIELPPKTEQLLRDQAKAAGADLNAYVLKLVDDAAARRSLDALLAPLRSEFADSGMSDEELVNVIEEARSHYRHSVAVTPR